MIESPLKWLWHAWIRPIKAQVRRVDQIEDGQQLEVDGDQRKLNPLREI